MASPEPSECVICLGDEGRLLESPCERCRAAENRHYYHEGCLEDAVRATALRKAKPLGVEACPTCRGTLAVRCERLRTPRSGTARDCFRFASIGLWRRSAIFARLFIVAIPAGTVTLLLLGLGFGAGVAFLHATWDHVIACGVPAVELLLVDDLPLHDVVAVAKKCFAVTFFLPADTLAHVWIALRGMLTCTSDGYPLSGVLNRIVPFCHLVPFFFWTVMYVGAIAAHVIATVRYAWNHPGNFAFRILYPKEK